MDDCERELVALGAAAAVNCKPCLDYHLPKCRAAGATEDDMQNAIATGFMVARGAQKKTREFAAGLLAAQMDEDASDDDRDDAPKQAAGCC